MALRFILVCAALLGVSGSLAEDLSCEFLAGVAKTPGSNTIYLSPLHPGQFTTKNANSPDATLRFVMDYSDDPQFANVAPLDVPGAVFQSIPAGGMDVADAFRTDGQNSVKAGRFVYIKESAPGQEFHFPQTRQLRPGRVYYFRNYVVHGTCVSPPVETHATFPSEVATTPVSALSQGLPSMPLGLAVTGVARDRLEVAWEAPLNSGDGTELGMAVDYVVTVTAQPDASTGGLLLHHDAGDAQQPSAVQAGTAASFLLEQGQRYRVDVAARNYFGAAETSPVASLLARPVGEPGRVARLHLAINPANSTNATGNSLGVLSWGSPLDTGVGPAAVAAGISGVPIERYRVLEAGAGVLQDNGNTSVVVNLAFNGAHFFQVSAKNLQSETLGYFSSFGNVSNNSLLLGSPPVMRLRFNGSCAPYCTNAQGELDALLNAERSCAPPQARGASDWCTAETYARTCEEQVSCAGAAGCVRCEDPVLAVFAQSTYVFQVSAGLAAGDASSAVRIEATGSAMAVVVMKTSEGGGSVSAEISFTPDLEMSRQGGYERMCFEGITGQNLRSSFCVRLRVTLSSPEFTSFPVAHRLFLGCAFELPLTASDRTEIDLDPQVALSKGYLVGIFGAGGAQISAYRGSSFTGLPTGSEVVSPSPARDNPVTSRFRWTPQRFQEGFVYEIQFEARGFIGGSEVVGVASNRSTAALRLEVVRCRFCAGPAGTTTLAALAAEWRSPWLSVWGGNHMLVDTDDVPDTQVVLGPTLQVSATEGCTGLLCNDALRRISIRYGIRCAFCRTRARAKRMSSLGIS
ncbi:hypothetical protein T484DRAFT_1967327, partial [Baffinella frigidus]